MKRKHKPIWEKPGFTEYERLLLLSATVFPNRHEPLKPKKLPLGKRILSKILRRFNETKK